MTRDQAKQRHMVWALRGPDVNQFDVAHRVIDAIYNDFESRTCDNCKHLNMTKFHFNEGGGDMYVPCDMIYTETTGANTLQEFGCNKFERE